ncbi:hypothetical protein OEG84_11385 [Hoeflea sp. G2-23]|uniref:Uncharacterized protein n=1 Tax=Hoeflea algicola TaxID=2983763 RepID=A0ABT3Z931_9HYPH|nr:hypothetical protein [Hoeflea algicola]MCY0148295.1 hypothetical protein [Hoeflea algicola]
MGLSLKRVVWKRQPEEQEVEYMKLCTLFGPSCFQRGNEWLFLRGEDPMCHAATPDGYERIN